MFRSELLELTVVPVLPMTAALPKFVLGGGVLSEAKFANFDLKPGVSTTLKLCEITCRGGIPAAILASATDL